MVTVKGFAGDFLNDACLCSVKKGNGNFPLVLAIN